jgi:hypothetical protein
MFNSMPRFVTVDRNAQLQSLANRERALREAAIALQNAIFTISPVTNFVRVRTLSTTPFTPLMTDFVLGSILRSPDVQQKTRAIARYQARLQELRAKINDLTDRLNTI